MEERKWGMGSGRIPVGEVIKKEEEDLIVFYLM